MTISTTATTTTAVLPLTVGDRARFARPAKEAHLWWVVQAGDDRFAILTRQATFKPKGELVYTIVDRERGVRGPCNRIGQGWDVEALGGCDRLLDALRRGDVEISHRNNISAEISQSQPGVEPRTATGLPVPAGRDQGFSTLAPSEPTVRNSALQYWLKWLEGRAIAYHAADPTRPSPGKLMCGYIRRNTYNGAQWDLVAGPIPSDWIAYVDSERTSASPSGVTEVTTYVDFQEVSSGVEYTTPHLFAAIDTYLNRGPWISQSSVHTSELGGWAGDLLSVLNAYVTYSSDPENPPMSIEAYAQVSIGCPTSVTTALGSWFNIEDLVQDADASIIAAAYLADPETSIADAVIEHIERGGPSAGMNRFEAFAVGRFGGTTGLQTAARSTFQTELDSTQGVAYLVLRTALLQSVGDFPVQLGDFTTAQLHAVADAFSVKVLDLV